MAFDNADGPVKRQKALTPKFLRKLHLLGATTDIRSNVYDHAVDLIIGAYFYAMRSCEYVKPTKPGKTKMLCLRHLLFRDARKRPLPLTHPHLPTVMEYCTVTFEDQKNGLKMDKRTHRRSLDPILCPSRLARAVQRVIAFVPNWSLDTPLCSVAGLTSTKLITQSFTLRLLRHTCRVFGGASTFGFTPREIGNKSLRSGAAMALFLRDYSVAKIMILGRWSSDAFLVYIRPQVLEWANAMSTDMTNFDSFLDVGMYDIPSKSDPKTRRRSIRLNGRGSAITIPAFDLHS